MALFNTQKSEILQLVIKIIEKEFMCENNLQQSSGFFSFLFVEVNRQFIKI